MRPPFLVCFAFLVSVVLIDADTSAADLIVFQSDFPKRTKFVNDAGISVNRFLRSNSGADKELTEERAGALSVPLLERLKGIFLQYVPVSPEKLTSWLKSGKSTDVVFIRLNLQGGENPFHKPQFADWVHYADELSAKRPEMSAISTLTSHYGDDRLFRMIRMAKTKPPTENLAKELETKLMQHWVATRKDPDEVFHLFNLDTVWDGIWEKPELSTWVQYVDDLNTKHPEKPAWMSSTLTKYFNDEVLIKMTNNLKMRGPENAKSIAAKVEDDWIQAGIQHYKTPYQALLDLGLGKEADNILKQLLSKDSLASTWVKYMEAFNRKYPAYETTVIETLTKTFGDVGVTNMLRTATEQSATRILATRLETAQLKMWLDNGESADNVFELLKLDQDPKNFILKDKHLLQTWVSFINFIVERASNKRFVKAALAENLDSLEYRFEDIPLNRILNMAKKFPSLKAPATKIQTKKIRGYFANKNTPGHVFRLLGLDDEGDDILSTSQFTSWLQYVENFNRQHGQQVSWFIPLHHAYKVERLFLQAIRTPSTLKIGKTLEKEWIKYWIGEKMSPKHTIVLLLAPDDEALISPALTTWSKYLEEFNKEYPAEKITMIDGLRANYNDFELLTMFKTAQSDPNTKKLASNLEKALVGI
ncbi:RxLR effector protein [Phytophthora megakarya]|uniref:RxLR effector protein n=1 Tax=Phytophthora megakarya TaxID=4795 RepID=A0A225WXB7_9STRA|nr:RxLR effector protein [Phytophthora megakarya]